MLGMVRRALTPLTAAVLLPREATEALVALRGRPMGTMVLMGRVEGIEAVVGRDKGRLAGLARKWVVRSS